MNWYQTVVKDVLLSFYLAAILDLLYSISFSAHSSPARWESSTCLLGPVLPTWQSPFLHTISTSASNQSHQYIGAANTKKIWEMGFLVLPVLI